MSPLSGVLGEAWELYKRHAAHFLPIAFVIYLVVAVVTALLSLAGTFGYFVGAIFALFGMFLVQAALVKAVQDVRDGRADLDLPATLRAALPYVGAVALASILASIGIWIGFILIIVPGLILLTFCCWCRGSSSADPGRWRRSAGAGGPCAASAGTCSAPTC